MTELEQTAAAEKERVLRLMTKAIDEIEEDGGNFEVFTVCLMEATFFHLVEQQGENVIPKNDDAHGLSRTRTARQKAKLILAMIRGFVYAFQEAETCRALSKRSPRAKRDAGPTDIKPCGMLAI